MMVGVHLLHHRIWMMMETFAATFALLDANYTGDAAENGGVVNTALLSNGNLAHATGAWTGSVGTFCYSYYW